MDRTISRRNCLNIECPNRDAKSDLVAEELIGSVETGTPFIHLRYGDGEFNSIIGWNRRGGRNADDHQFFPETLGKALIKVLDEVAQHDHDGILFGGWWDERYLSFMEAGGYRDKIPWCSAGTFYYEIESLRVLRLIRAMRDYRGRKVLVGNHRISRAAKVIGAEFVEVPDSDCWLKYNETLAQCTVNDGDLVIACCGMMANVLLWELWKRNPRTLLLNFGHIFDACYGYRRRGWLKKKCLARRVFRRKYLPMFRIDETEPDTAKQL